MLDVLNVVFTLYGDVDKRMRLELHSATARPARSRKLGAGVVALGGSACSSSRQEMAFHYSWSRCVHESARAHANLQIPSTSWSRGRSCYYHRRDMFDHDDHRDVDLGQYPCVWKTA